MQTDGLSISPGPVSRLAAAGRGVGQPGMTGHQPLVDHIALNR